MSRWMYQMSERSWRFRAYRKKVAEMRSLRWGTGRVMFSHEPPAAGDLIFLFYAEAHCSSPGVCGFGVITKYHPKKRRFDWTALPPTKVLASHPWWDERVKEIAELIRAQSPRGTMYPIPAVVDTDLRRGLFSWATAQRRA